MSAEELATAESAGYNRAMREMTEAVARLQERGDRLTRELESLENRRIREVHSASWRGQVYAKEIYRAKRRAARDALNGLTQELRELIPCAESKAQQDRMKYAAGVISSHTETVYPELPEETQS